MSTRAPVRQLRGPLGGALRRAAAATTATPPQAARAFSMLERGEPKYPGHVPLTPVERLAMAVGSSLGSMINPRRADLIATCGETTATPYFLGRLRDEMLADATGRRILRDRPRITSASLSLDKLAALPPGSVGRTYAAWLEREGVTPDDRLPVRYVDDEECAYVMQRYRECHDFYHALVGLPVLHEGEVALKAFEWANTGLPMTGMAVLSALRMRGDALARFRDTYLPWALRNGAAAAPLINVYWEERLGDGVAELRRELGIENPPDLRAARRKARDDRRAAKAAREEGHKV